MQRIISSKLLSKVILKSDYFLFSSNSKPKTFNRFFSERNLDIERIQKKVQDDLKKRESKSQGETSVNPSKDVAADEEKGYFDLLNKLAGSVKNASFNEMKDIPKDQDLAIRKRGDVQKKQQKEKGELDSNDIKQFFELHKSNPNQWNATALAEKFNLEVPITESLLKNYAIPVEEKKDLDDKKKR